MKKLGQVLLVAFVLMVVSAAVYELAVGIARHFGKPYAEFGKNNIHIVQEDWPYLFNKHGYIYSLERNVDDSWLETISEYGSYHGKYIRATLIRTVGRSADIFIKRYKSGPVYLFFAQSDKTLLSVMKFENGKSENLYDRMRGDANVPVEYKNIFVRMDTIFDQLKLKLNVDELLKPKV